MYNVDMGIALVAFAFPIKLATYMSVYISIIGYISYTSRMRERVFHVKSEVGSSTTRLYVVKENKLNLSEQTVEGLTRLSRRHQFP